MKKPESGKEDGLRQITKQLRVLTTYHYAVDEQGRGERDVHATSSGW